MTDKIPAWLNRPDVVRVLSLLNEGAATTKCVGGCVRDFLLGIDSSETEVDMATTLTPDEVQSRLNAAGINNKPIGIEHGTIFAFLEKRTIEITTLRCDVETDGRHAKVAFTTDWTKDAARRDFTINALYMDAHGKICDPTGQGLQDIENKTVRFIGNAEDRIKEDYLRILRFVRFYYGLTDGIVPDEKIKSICRAAIENLATLSAERKRDEFLKILGAQRSADAVHYLRSIRAMKYIIGFEIDEKDSVKLDDLMAHHFDKEKNNFPTLTRLAVLLPNQEAGKKAAETLNLSNADKKYLISILEEVDTRNIEERIEKEFYWHGRNIVLARLLVSDYDKYNEVVWHDWQAPTFPISGARLKQEGIKEGKEMGALLKDLENWWVDNGFSNEGVEGQLQIRLRERH